MKLAYKRYLCYEGKELQNYLEQMSQKDTRSPKPTGTFSFLLMLRIHTDMTQHKKSPPLFWKMHLWQILKRICWQNSFHF